MSEILNELQEVKKASQEQTAASQAQTAEVAGKMGEINQALAAAQQQFDDFVSGDFDENVGNSRSIIVFIDPLEGSDANNGLTQATAIKTSHRLHELAHKNYSSVSLHLRNGTVFNLEKFLFAKDVISINAYSGSDGSLDKPIFRQAAAFNAYVSAQEIKLISCRAETYAAVSGEELPPVYSGRCMFGHAKLITGIYSEIVITDNQLLHVHSGGSGDDLHRTSLSFFHTTLEAANSADNVTGTQKTVFSWYATTPDYPLDLFGVNFSAVLNGHHATFRDFLSVPATHIITNLTLS
ncbi:hypothetical protein NOL51_24535 [Vibrio parahaemolyticus]|uniref:hypothetical protein n=1 Tax=Vibrio parahaemolyticus TaxID=670 RepID=UPI00226AF612|nr:hypothetical protein [Vibrio parahaemolyticus]MCX8936235.1 hypothetical protein [Vibrio parahaemolyticus]